LEGNRGGYALVGGVARGHCEGDALHAGATRAPIFNSFIVPPVALANWFNSADLDLPEAASPS